MKKFLEKWMSRWMAAAFAEAGEFETAREILKPKKVIRKRARYYA